MPFRADIRESNRFSARLLTHGDFHPLLCGVALNLAEDEGKTQLNVSWVNKTSYEVVYGESYDIEREQNGKWSSCAINDLIFNAL